jgi:hypothetical protein
MNANDIAEELESIHWLQDGAKAKPFQHYADFIRQQEKELTEAGHMIGVLHEYISDLENGLDSSIKLNKAQALRKAQEK